MPFPETRASLLLRIRDSADERAWQEFQEIYEPVVYRFARQRGLQDADARELTQEVLISVAGAIDRWNPSREKGTFRSWLYRIARNQIVNQVTRKRDFDRPAGDSRTMRLLNEHPNRDEGSQFDVEFRRETFHWAARRARGHFHPTTWEAFWKCCVEGDPAAQVARDLNVSVGSVYVARSRVMARLRQLVQRIAEER